MTNPQELKEKWLKQQRKQQQLSRMFGYRLLGLNLSAWLFLLLLSVVINGLCYLGMRFDYSWANPDPTELIVHVPVID